MRRHSAYLFGAGLALPMLALVAGLQVPTVAASPQNATIDVNRALKGDRLRDSFPAAHANAPDLVLDVLRVPRDILASLGRSSTSVIGSAIIRQGRGSRAEDEGGREGDLGLG